MGNRFYTESLEERFWPKVDRGGPDDCWPWQGRCHPYGSILVPGDVDATGAHRVSWMLHFGAVPRGAHVLHHCDNPPCVNPRHLFLGTQSMNNRDRHSKGRGGLPPVHHRGRHRLDCPGLPCECYAK